ncbi:hypothetical protein [Streptomyces sp. t39]|uniref:hypothetical protein n=1 Tax=Streptomyces sp. t39 TaxID=1828156 RepID=UPI0011CDEE46|nr:hypothetical protein [Streptomyces sp. t39]TXS50101.1 hypothetical protein EAO77_28230 [Streptomyces sp. t39]
MRMKMIAAAGFLGLLLTGCGAGSDDDSAPKPAFPELPQKIVKPVPEPTGAPHPSPLPGAAFHERVAHGLREKVIDMVNTDGATTARCPGSLKEKDGAQAVCVSTWEGLRIEWDILVYRLPDPPNDLKWGAEPRMAILTRDGAANAVYGYYVPDLVRCNNIPEAVLVPVEREMKEYTCQTVTDGRAGKPMPVRVGLGGPYFRCRGRTEVHACG